MAAGTSRMAKQNVIVRKLASLEALGGITLAHLFVVLALSHNLVFTTQGYMLRQDWHAHTGENGGEVCVDALRGKFDDPCRPDTISLGGGI